MTAPLRPTNAVRMHDGTLTETPIAGARALVFEAFIPVHIESLNVTLRQHWSKRSRAKHIAAVHLRKAMRNEQLADGFRFVKLISFRPRLIADDDNLVGGAKTLRDAIAAVGLIVDDSDIYCYFDYRQESAKRSPTGKPGTLVQVFSP